MKTTKEPSKIEIHRDGRISKGDVIVIAFVWLLVGFMIGATVVILRTSKQLMVAPTAEPMVAPNTKESERNRLNDCEEEVRPPEGERK
jgi:hypothetical protein